MKMKKFRITIDCDVELDTNSIWVDGGAPENPTAEDIIEVIKKTSHGFTDFITSWNLEDDVDVFVIDSEEKTIKEVKW